MAFKLAQYSPQCLLAYFDRRGYGAWLGRDTAKAPLVRNKSSKQLVPWFGKWKPEDVYLISAIGASDPSSTQAVGRIMSASLTLPVANLLTPRSTGPYSGSRDGMVASGGSSCWSL